MNRQDPRYAQYIQILKDELIPATGCTEPIALAYGAARARSVLGKIPDRVEIIVSGNIIKNVKSVVVPNTGGLKGIEAAVAAGIVAGDETKLLDVLGSVTQEDKARIQTYLDATEMTVRPTEAGPIFDINLILHAGEDYVRLRIADRHTNVVLLERNGKRLLEVPWSEQSQDAATPEEDSLTVKAILDFAETVDLADIQDVLENQLTTNMAIAKEGLTNDWGACVGKVIASAFGNSIPEACKAAAAAGSDARMSGCEMPVVICAGSGNQGITASVPVAVYAERMGYSHETLLRGLIVSDLLTLHQKSGIGRLSAYCGAICAGCAAGAAMAWMDGGGFRAVSHTLVNSLAIVSGIVCDGAKPSCAAKIATAVDAGIFGYEMYKREKQFLDGEGIVKKGVENTIANVGRLGRDGMRETDREILSIMIGE